MWIDVSGDGISETLEDPGDVLLEPPPFDPPEPPTPFFLGGEMTACAGGWSSSGECGWWLPLASEPVDDRGDRVGGDLLVPPSPPVLCEPGRNASSDPPPSLARSAMDSSGMCSSPTTSGSGEGDEGRPAPRVGEVLKIFTGLGRGCAAARLGEPDATSPSVRPMRSMSESSV